jgi:hypothetical protein
VRLGKAASYISERGEVIWSCQIQLSYGCKSPLPKLA